MDTLILLLSSACLLAGGLLRLLRAKGARRGRGGESQAGGQPQPATKRSRQGTMAENDEGALDAALYLDLAASMLAAGLPVRALLEQLGQVDGGRFRAFLGGVVIKLDAGASWAQAWGSSVPQALTGVYSALGMSLETGAPSADFLRVLADRQRRHRQRALEKSAAKLSVKLVVPLGLCSLPAFICLGVVPVLIAMVPSLM